MIYIKGVKFGCCFRQESASGSTAAQEVWKAPTPVRVFKIVFVGDSGVGKSSFIHRFCHDQWKPSFTATIGKEYYMLQELF